MDAGLQQRLKTPPDAHSRLGIALSDVGSRHVKKLAGMHGGGAARNENRKRVYDSVVALDAARSSVCIVSELDDGLHRGERLWSTMGIAVSLPHDAVRT